jgi:chitodextrinase
LIVSSNRAPVAVAAASCAYRSCEFDATASSDQDGTLVAYDWDFGDGTSSTEATPDHSYDDLGPYTVTLTVTDDEGLTDTTTVDVDATNAPPEAAFTVTCDNQTCDFDASGSSDQDGTIVSYDWDFGDGDAGVGAAASHSYTTGDRYTVSLTVTDNDDGRDVLVLDLAVESALEVHLHDLTPSPYDLEGDKWVARVIVKVRDANGDPVEGVEITAAFGAGKLRSCATNEFGKCKVKIKTADTRPKIPMEIIEVEWSGGYDAAANRDTDGDGNGETVMVWRPF